MKFLKKTAERIALKIRNILVATSIILLTACSSNPEEFEQTILGTESILGLVKESEYTDLPIEAPDHAILKALGSSNLIEILSETEEQLGREIRWKLSAQEQIKSEDEERVWLIQIQSREMLPLFVCRILVYESGIVSGLSEVQGRGTEKCFHLK